VAQNVTDWVWKHSRAVNGSLIVLLAIAHEANRDGITAMSVLELSQKTRLSERSVQNATAELARHRELAVHLKAGDHGRNGYEVTMPRGADIAPLPGSKGADSAPLAVTPQNLHPAESAPLERHNGRSERNPAESAPLAISNMFITSTGIDEVQVKNVPAITSRPDVERLCRHLADRIEANGCKRPAIGKKWRDAARLMIDRDGRTEQQITAAIDWCQDSEFWRANILSMPKLREKYDQLRMQAVRKPASSRQAETDELFGAAMKRAIAREGRK
jgi:hypothetical protein